MLVCLLIPLLSIISQNLGENETSINTEMQQISLGVDWILCSQPLNYETIQDGLIFSASGHMLADDIQFAGLGAIFTIDIWAVYPDNYPYDFNIQLRSNTPTGPGEIIASTTANSVENNNTGLTVFGYPIYHTKIDPFHTLEASGGIVWLTLQPLAAGGGYAYWLCTNQTWGEMSYCSEDHGSNWISSLERYGEAYEQFMVIEGQYLPLVRNSWGSIKTSF